MKSLRWPLICIACILAIDLLFDRVLPVVESVTNRIRYENLAADCQTARIASERARSESFDSPTMKRLVEKSIDVQYLACTDEEIVRSKLLGLGVSPATIRAMELEGIKKQTTLRVADSGTSDADLDSVLFKVVQEYNLRPLQVRRFGADPKFLLGRDLFFDPVLSGTKQVSCATCHILKYGTSDGLPRSIGVFGVGVGPNRKAAQGVILHPRNALDLWNRDNNAVKSLFWDGRVEVLDPVRRVFRSPLGDALPSGLDNALAVQALFPLVTPDEMLSSSISGLQPLQADSSKGAASTRPSDAEVTRIQAAHDQILMRVLGANKPNRMQEGYRTLFANAYPDKLSSAFSIVDLANAIAHFEEMAFATRDSRWDRYLRGDKKTLSVEAKRGVLLFYGKAKCAACHDGPLFSDFDYHSVGIFSVRTDLTGQPPDYGRFDVTGVSSDKYRFRTPPLRNVTKTGPYFHDGSEPNLNTAIRRHINPLDTADKYNDNGSFAMSREQIESISSIFVPQISLSEQEIDRIVAFLSCLDSEPSNLSLVIPKQVPSKLPLAYQ